MVPGICIDLFLSPIELPLRTQNLSSIHFDA
jgi:hypothetical protein